MTNTDDPFMPRAFTARFFGFNRVQSFNHALWAKKLPGLKEYGTIISGKLRWRRSDLEKYVADIAADRVAQLDAAAAAYGQGGDE